ncbi:MAG: rod shape-determining protein RodA [Cyanobacteria bacterium]|nr:rod shape-determining protein RodA [Cyanobacteriota bacterium]
MKLGAKASRRWPWRNIDPLLWGIPIAMTILAGLLIASTQREAPLADWKNHWITGAVGLATAALLAKIDLDKLKPLLIPIYLLTLTSLFSVKFMGTSALGAQRWISIAGLNVQPSEFAKLAAILLLAGILAKHPVERPVDLIRPLAVISLPWALVFLQPDLGTSLVYGAIVLAMLFWAGLPLPWLLLLLSPLATAIITGALPIALLPWFGLLAFMSWRSLPWKRIGSAIALTLNSIFALLTPFLWTHGLKDYQKDRLILFLDPSKDPLGGGYHLIQSQIGIGSGQLFGTGLMQGNLTKLQFIPEQHTDFIFSALGEELGFIGALLLLLAYGLLSWKLLQVAGIAGNDFESLVVIGILSMVMFQVVINISMTIGLGPVTGIPLPWMSYGRFAMFVNFISVGLVASVQRRAKKSGLKLR